jgi:GNAT superfamily N-acetyltransferase
MALSFRRATPADAEAVSRQMIDALGEYPAFAPPGWEPPPLDAEIEHTRHLLADPDVWCRLAEADGELVGQVTIMPATRAAHAVDEPALAHFRNLFVRQDFRGTGLARTLHDAAAADARERGFSSMRLFVAAGYGRARRFYEREGWTAAGDAFYDPIPNLTIVEYRIGV